MQTNNNLRGALSKILIIAEYLQTRCGVPKFVANEISEIEQAAKAALAEPIKNCEVGTAEEQEDRFRRYCNSRRTFCGDCPLYNNRRGECRFTWAQMPYESEAAK